jgi:hypothetical protein
MNDDLIIHALRSEQQLARPEFSAPLHDRLASAIDRERRRRRRRLAVPLAACVAAIALFAVRDSQTTGDQDIQLAAPQTETPSLTATAGVEFLLQRSDRAAAEIRERMDLPKWSLDRALDSSKLTRAVFNRLPVGRLIESPSDATDSDQPAPRPQAPA